ncbi:tetratricopeptide repeat protein [Amycolatopsis sp. NPDC003731]
MVPGGVQRAQREGTGGAPPQARPGRHNLAQWRGRSGDPDAAVTELAQLLEDQKRILGPEHPGTHATHASLAQWLVDNGEPRRAAEELELLLAETRRFSDPDHPTSLVRMSSLAASYRRLGEYQKARRLDTDVLDRRRRRLGSDHPDTLSSATNLAIDLRLLGEYQEAKELDRDVFDRRRRRLGSDHPDTLSSATNLAIDLRQLGEHMQALALDRLTAARRRQLRPSDRDTRRAEQSVATQEKGSPRIFLSHSPNDTVIADAIVYALQANGMVVRTAGMSIAPGAKIGGAIDRELELSDAVVVLLTESGMHRQQRSEIDLALRRDALTIRVAVGSLSPDVERSFPLPLFSRQGIRLDAATSDALDTLATSVLRAVDARRELTTSPPADGRHAEMASAAPMVRDAFAAAHRPLQMDDEVPELLWPGPVWVSDDAAPADLDRFARHLSHGQLGYFVHTADLPRHARIALDEMRLSGTPVITVSARSLRAAYADQRVAGFLTELERDYGNRDNLFDTKNALIDERFLYGRDLLLNTIGSALRRDENVLITGLRKVGKTSLLNILRQRLTDRPVCVVDLQRFDRHSEDWPGSLFKLMEAAFDNWGRAEHEDWPFVSSSPATATELEAALEDRQAYLRSQGKPVRNLVVILDELERIYPTPGEDHAARKWVRATGALRALAQSDRRHVVVVGADLRPSVNRDNDLGPAGTNPFFAFFQEVPVTLLDRDAVERMVRDIGQAMAIDRISGGFVRELFEKTGGHPSLIRTIAAEASRARRDRHALTGSDLAAALDRLYDDDAIGFFFRNNLWQLMTAAEQAVVRNLALGRPIPGFVPTSAQRAARAALRAQGLIGDSVHIGLFRSWLRDEEC